MAENNNVQAIQDKPAVYTRYDVSIEGFDARITVRITQLGDLFNARDAKTNALLVKSPGKNVNFVMGKATQNAIHVLQKKFAASRGIKNLPKAVAA